MEQSPLEANSHSATQEIPRLLSNTKVHYRVHDSPPLVLSWARWIQSTLSRFPKIHSNIIYPPTHRPCVTFRNILSFTVRSC